MKQKNGDQVRFLQGEVRKLKKIVRHLEQENRALQKWDHLNLNEIGQDDKEIIEDTEDTYIKRGVPCDFCGKGFYKEFEIRGMVYGTCGVCEHRKKLK